MAPRTLYPVLILLFLLSACTPQAEESPASGPTPALERYQTPTPSLISAFTPDAVKLSTPTPTPFIYVVKKSDVLGSIALEYGVSIEALMTANPKVNPDAMSIGINLVIPAGQKVLKASNVTPTPVPLALDTPACYQDATGGAWCFLLAGNAQADAIENPAARITLYAPDGQFLQSQIATAPLNLLPQGSVMPLMAYFPPTLPAGFLASAELVTAFPAMSIEERYAAAKIEDQKTDIAPDGLSARVSGQITWDGEGVTVKRLALVATAYDHKGTIAGVRKWEFTELPETENRFPFDEEIFSSGPAIDKVELLVEARP